jgi:hypothetical protein
VRRQAVALVALCDSLAGSSRDYPRITVTVRVQEGNSTTVSEQTQSLLTELNGSGNRSFFGFLYSHRIV